MLKKSVVSAVVLTLGLFLGFSDLALAVGGGLVGHWKFDVGEGQTVKDLSGNGNDGTLDGPFWVKNGLKFDGVDDHVHVPASESLNITEQITFEAWVKPEKSDNLYNNVIITREGTWFFGVMQNDKVHNSIKLPYEHQKKMGKEWNISVISKPCLKPDIFNHIAGTYDSETGIVKVYANGECVAKATGAALPTPGPGDFAIGNTWHGDYYFHGIMKEVRIYNQALTNEEIEENYYMGTF